MRRSRLAVGTSLVLGTLALVAGWREHDEVRCLALVVLAACYSPAVHPGAPCSDSEPCPAPPGL